MYEYYFKATGYDGLTCLYVYDYNVTSEYELALNSMEKNYSRETNYITYYNCSLAKYNNKSLDYDYSDGKVVFNGSVTKIDLSDSSEETSTVSVNIPFVCIDALFGGSPTWRSSSYFNLNTIDTNIPIFNNATEIIDFYNKYTPNRLFTNDMEYTDKETLESYMTEIESGNCSNAISILDNNLSGKGVRADIINKITDEIKKLECFVLNLVSDNDVYYSVDEPTDEQMDEKKFWIKPI